MAIKVVPFAVLDLGASGKEFEMCVKSHRCVSFELWSRPLLGAGLLECQGPLVSETQLWHASDIAANTDEQRLKSDTGPFLNLYFEKKMIHGPEFKWPHLKQR